MVGPRDGRSFAKAFRASKKVQVPFEFFHYFLSGQRSPTTHCPIKRRDYETNVFRISLWISSEIWIFSSWISWDFLNFVNIYPWSTSEFFWIASTFPLEAFQNFEFFRKNLHLFPTSITSFIENMYLIFPFWGVPSITITPFPNFCMS